jgi:hypothetical protein
MKLLEMDCVNVLEMVCENVLVMDCPKRFVRGCASETEKVDRDKVNVYRRYFDNP